MYVVMLNYVKPLEEVDRHVQEHVAFLKEQYAAGAFLLSGRRIPRTGGVLLVRDMPREELDNILAVDPFSVAGVAEYSVCEFSPTLGAGEFSHLLV